MEFSSLARPLLLPAAASSALLFASCASGPTYAEVKPTLPPIPKGEGRVFVYRPSGLGAVAMPGVKIDGKVVGQSKGRGFFYSDQSPGAHEVSIMTEWNHKTTVNVAAGRPSFVECGVLPGVVTAHILPKQVDEINGENKIQDCKLVK